MEATLSEVIKEIDIPQVGSSEPMPKRTPPDSNSYQKKLPDGVLEADWDKVPQRFREQFKAALVAKQFPIYICGDAGRGKTFSMASAYMHCKVRSALWIDFQPFVKRIMAARCGEGGSEYLSMESVKNSEFLCVDDCGIRADSEAQQSLFLEILNVRQGKATVFTGNHDPQNLHKIFDSRIASRLMSGAIFKFTGPDRRLAGRKIIEIKC